LHLFFRHYATGALVRGYIVEAMSLQISYESNNLRTWLSKRGKHSTPPTSLLRTPIPIGFLQRKEGKFTLAMILSKDIAYFSGLRPDGTWFTFTGDQLGTIFASRALETYKASGKPLGEEKGK
jgi:hypothetical protein